MLFERNFLPMIIDLVIIDLAFQGVSVEESTRATRDPSNAFLQR